MAGADRGTILIVDEDPAFRNLVATHCTRAGLETVEADAGERALEIIRHSEPALVILDVCLPDISGFEVCRVLRDDVGDDLPIIFVSGERTDPLDRAVGLLLGGDDYVAKPVNPDELLARIRRQVARAARRQLHKAVDPAELDLTRRELEVLRNLAQGLRPAEIAKRLNISPNTVSSHLQHVLSKLGVHSRAEAVAFAYERALVNGAPAPTTPPVGM